MGSEYTKGPLSHYAHGNSGASWGVGDENGREVATVRTSEADARLIAAAPDLLAACEAVADWADGTGAMDGPPGGVDSNTKARVLAAIAKVRGEGGGA